MNFNSLRKLIIDHSTLSLFILTAVSYGVAYIYEQTRWLAYDISLDSVNVKIGSLVMAAFCIIVAGGLFYLLDKQLHVLLLKKFKDERSVVYLVGQIRAFILSVVVLLLYVDASKWIKISSDDLFLLNFTSPFFNFMTTLLVIITSLSLLNPLVRYVFSRNKKGYTTYLKHYAEIHNNDDDPMTARWVTWVISGFIIVGFPAHAGLTAPHNTTSYIVLTEPSSQTLKVVIDTFDSTLLVKEYDTQNKKFLDGYSLLSSDNKSFHKWELEE